MTVVEYNPQKEKDSLAQFLFAVSNAVQELYIETDFKDYFPKSEHYTWEMFKNALTESLESFQRDVMRRLNGEYRPPRFYRGSYESTGFKGPSLQFKIAFWNNLVIGYNKEQQERGIGFRILKKIIQKILDFINIILGSAGLLTGNDGLDEMKKLGEWIIVDAIPDDED